MKSTTIVSTLAFSLASVIGVFGQTTPLPKSQVIGTVHDINGGGCKSCHAAHNGAVTNGGTQAASGQILLWARTFSTQTFGVYSSPSMKNTPTEVGGSGALDNTQTRMYSLLCLSCHDGVTSGTSVTFANPGVNQVGNPTSSFGLSNDHPINLSHNPTTQPSLQPVATVTTAGIPLYGANNSVQCASCHEAHSQANTRFLRLPVSGSALCLKCHI